MSVVLDASALLAVLNDERGADVVLQSLRGAMMSAVNVSETLAKAGDRGLAHARVDRMIDRLRIEVVPFDRSQAAAAAALRPMTFGRRVSFADRACLALARSMNRPALTADAKWADLDLGVDVRLIR